MRKILIGLYGDWMWMDDRIDTVSKEIELKRDRGHQPNGRELRQRDDGAWDWPDDLDGDGGRYR